MTFARILALYLALTPATLLLAPRAEAASAEAVAALKEIEALYGTGDYDGTTRRVNELLLADQDLPSDRRAVLYLMKARLEFAYGRPLELRLWLTKSFRANPRLTLDPVKDPPQLIAIWEELRGQSDGRSGTGALSQGPVTTGTGSFWVGLFPLGIGHFDAGRYKDGALFLSVEALAALTAGTLPEEAGEATFGGFAFAGAYGYELLSMMPDLRQRDAGLAHSVRHGLSLFPFGVGQAKNNEPVKAVTLAALQSALLTAGTLAEDGRQRQIALGLFGMVWGYGILDAFSNHHELAGGEAASPLRLGVVPVRREGTWGPLLTVAWSH